MSRVNISVYKQTMVGSETKTKTKKPLAKSSNRRPAAPPRKAKAKAKASARYSTNMGAVDDDADRYRYTVLPMDVDGNGIPDGDIIEKFDIKTQKVVSRIFVPKKDLDKIVKDMKVAEKTANANANAKVAPSDSIVRVKEKTSFLQSLKTGFGSGIGHAAAGAMVNGIGKLF